MTSPSVTPASTQPLQPSFVARLLKKRVLHQLERLHHGHLVVFADGERHEFGVSGSTPSAELHVTHPAVWMALASYGSIGAGEAYIHNYWHSPDLTALIRLFVANLDVLDQLEGGLARLGQPILKTLHWLNRNTKDGSRRNISAHYDLGNALFEQMLDPTMMYSSAIFAHNDATLEQAQLNKLERICQKLQLTAEDHLLEIGTGWGSMALYAASHYGCRVTTTTLSQEQYNYTQQRINNMGLQDRVTLLLKDYRDLDGQYDKLVSIEMIEAVGHRYLPQYFKQCAQLLKPDGLMLLQAITIRDQRYEKAKNAVDFIQRYIFPGGALPSVTCIMDTLTRYTDFNLKHMEDFGPHYARTLHLWHQNLIHARKKLETLGYDEQFFRLWEFYLCYCEGGFIERAIGAAQLLLAKPQARPVTFGLEE